MTRRCRPPGRAPAPPGTRRSAALDRLFTDPAGEAALDDLDTQLRGGLRVDWPAMTRSTKRAVADGILRSEVLRLARLVPDVVDADAAADAIAELLSSFSVYRTYLPLGADYLAEAVDRGDRRPGRRSSRVAARDRRPARAMSAPSSRCGSSRPPAW